MTVGDRNRERENDGGGERDRDRNRDRERSIHAKMTRDGWERVAMGRTCLFS